MRPLPQTPPLVLRRDDRGDVTDRMLGGPRYRRVMRGVYQPAGDDLSFESRMLAARSCLPDGAVLSGQSAAWVHGVDWFVERDTPIEVALPHEARVRTRLQLAVRARTFRPDEVIDSPWGPVTTLARTAYDLGRARSFWWSVPRLDALARPPRTTRPSVAPGRLWSEPVPRGTGRLVVDEVLAIADRNRGARWIRRLPGALDLMDAGAESPPESTVRLRLVLGGLPRPETQIELFDAGRFVARLDMGWEALRLGIEYDGAHHDDPAQVSRDRARLNAVQACGWRVLLVDRTLYAAGDRLIDEVARARRQLLDRRQLPASRAEGDDAAHRR